MTANSKPNKAKLRRVRFIEAELTLPKVWLARLFAQSKGDHATLERTLREGLLGRQQRGMQR